MEKRCKRAIRTRFAVKKRTLIKSEDQLLTQFGLDHKQLQQRTFVSGLCEYVDLYGGYGLTADDPDRTFPRKDDRIDHDKERFMIFMQFVKEGAHTFYDRQSDTYMTEGGTIVGVRFGAYIYDLHKVTQLEPLLFPFDAKNADKALGKLFEKASALAQQEST